MKDELVLEITKKIENYKNTKKESWREVYENVFDSYENLTSDEKNTLLVKVVNRITRDGYSIEDQPFRLVKF